MRVLGRHPRLGGGSHRLGGEHLHSTCYGICVGTVEPFRHSDAHFLVIRQEQSFCGQDGPVPSQGQLGTLVQGLIAKAYNSSLVGISRLETAWLHALLVPYLGLIRQDFSNRPHNFGNGSQV